MRALGLVFLVFLPSMVTTPMAGSVSRRVGPGVALPASLVLALGGLLLMLLPNLASIIAGMVLVGVGTFFAQAIATGHVGRIATHDKAAASGLYLSSYYCGGLVGAAIAFFHAGFYSRHGRFEVAHNHRLVCVPSGGTHLRRGHRARDRY